ncbi:MAG: hypothetical protein Q4D81_11070, partial [Eubacteriales bacterium]|nr:hypothetical protein [Eubacteriales bacterium]
MVFEQIGGKDPGLETRYFRRYDAFRSDEQASDLKKYLRELSWKPCSLGLVEGGVSDEQRLEK